MEELRLRETNKKKRSKNKKTYTSGIGTWEGKELRRKEKEVNVVVTAAQRLPSIQGLPEVPADQTSLI